VLINDKPLSDFGLQPVSSDGRVAFASGSLVVSEIAETAGAQASKREDDRPRRVTVRCRVRGHNRETFFANRDLVADLLDVGALEVRFTDVADLAERILYCQFERMGQPGGPAPEWMSPNREFELVLLATNPYYHDRFAGIAGAGLPGIPVGTARTILTTELHGALGVALTLTFKDFRGATLAALKYDDAVSAGEWLEIRHDLAQVRLFTAPGTSVPAMGGLDLSVANFGFFAPTPETANRAEGHYPTVTVTGGSAVSVINKFRRAWH